MPEFLENRVKDISRIKRALERGDFNSISSIGHNMKGSGGSYGLTMISELGKQIEVAASQRDVEAIKWLTEKLSTYLNTIEILEKNDS
ncbi:MAG: Hpt domain-containing protein [Syntrophorhabdaceae bacterium]|nr:Hpt domain-containing protein [Syntrophorhabdaceae bacterium]